MKVALIYNKSATEASDVIDIFGPQTKEHYNPKTVERVAAALEKGGHNVKIIEGNIAMADELRDFMPKTLSGERPGMVFNMAYGIQGQSRYTHIPAILEMLGVPYVGSGPQAHAIALDKIMTKIVFQQNGLSTPPFWFFSSAEENMDDVVFPVIVKPKMEAVSMGLTVARDQETLREAVDLIVREYRQQALVEAFIAGREFAVGGLGNLPDLEILPVVEIDLGGDPDAIQTVDDKKHKPMGKLCPAPVTDEQAEDMRRLVRESFRALGVCDFGRIDFRMDADGALYLLELNSMASLGLTGSYVHAAKTAGYTFDSLVNRMLEAAAVRYFGRSVFEGGESDRQKAQPLRVRLRTYLRSQREVMRDNLKRMANVHTYVRNIEEVNQVGQWLGSRLTQLGFQREVFPQTETGHILYFSNRREAPLDVLLLGYLDSASAAEQYAPFREERGRYYGDSVLEHKGGLAVMLAALHALRYTRQLKKVRCGVLLVADDNLGGRFSKEIIAAKAAGAGCVLGLKGSSGIGLAPSCSGYARYRLTTVNAKAAAGAQEADAILALSRHVLALHRMASKSEEGVRIRPTSIRAQNTPGPGTDQGEAVVELRFQEQAQYDRLAEEIKRLIKKHADPHLQQRARLEASYPPRRAADIDRALLDKVQDLAGKLEVKVASGHWDMASSICFAPEGAPALEGFGPNGGGAFSRDEYVLRDSMIDRAALLALTLYSVAAGRAS